MTTSPGLVNTAARPRAERVIDGDTYHVTLDLEGVADQILTDIFIVLHREHRWGQAMLIGNPRTTALERCEMRAKLRSALMMAGALTVKIDDPADAEELQADLFEATTEPGWCDCDTAYATRADGLCDSCGNTADGAQANISQIRAV